MKMRTEYEIIVDEADYRGTVAKFQGPPFGINDAAHLGSATVMVFVKTDALARKALADRLRELAQAIDEAAAQ